MRCEQFDEKLEAYVDGELPADDAKNLEDHLEECSLCRTKLEDRLEMRRIIRGEFRASAPDDLRDRILTAAAASEQGSRAPSRAGGRISRRWLRTGQLTALAAAATLAVILLGPQSIEQGDDAAGPEAFSRPSRVVVPRYGESADQATPVKFGGIVLARASERNSK